MRRHFSLLLVITTILLGSAWLFQGPVSRAEDQEKPAEKAADKEKKTVKKVVVQAFMRKKLAAAQSVLEGLAVENFDLIADGAKQLKALAGASEFMVSDDKEYVEHADDFRRIVNKLGVAAKEKRLDGATLAYLDMTLGCVECHKHVRGLKIPDRE